MSMLGKAAIGIAVVFMASILDAATGSISISLHVVTDKGTEASIGTVEFYDTGFGMLVVPDLYNLSQGPHAAHVHEVADCGPSVGGVPAGAAGDHYDPENSGSHAGPYANGHLGDLPNLIVEESGAATIPVLAPRVNVSDLRGRALVIHAGADRYDSHSSHRHGTGGNRVYCGVIP